MENTINPKLARANEVLREVIREQFKRAAPELYAEYRKIRYPTGKGSETTETRTKSVLYLFDMAREVIAPHYVHEKQQLDAIVENEDEEHDGDGDDGDESGDQDD